MRRLVRVYMVEHRQRGAVDAPPEVYMPTLRAKLLEVSRPATGGLVAFIQVVFDPEGLANQARPSKLYANSRVMPLQENADTVRAAMFAGHTVDLLVVNGEIAKINDVSPPESMSHRRSILPAVPQTASDDPQVA